MYISSYLVQTHQPYKFSIWRAFFQQRQHPAANKNVETRYSPRKTALRPRKVRMAERQSKPAGDVGNELLIDWETTSRRGMEGRALKRLFRRQVYQLSSGVSVWRESREQDKEGVLLICDRGQLSQGKTAAGTKRRGINSNSNYKTLGNYVPANQCGRSQ